VRHVFAGIRVSDLAVSADWFERLFGSGASFVPNDTELVWDHCEGGSLFIEQSSEGAGFSRVTLFVDDLDDFLGAAAERGIEPVHREVYDNGVRHATFHDPDGNAVSVADMPAPPG
jgi:catechol 2,3-dioxygenase-like lactoylglutathione lyase family enzyme